MATSNTTEQSNTTTTDFMSCNGREVIYTSYEEITKENIIDILGNSLPIFEENRIRINYLNNYYRGITPIYNKTKTVRPEINNKISVNRAAEIIDFKVGYLLNEPVQYVSYDSDKKQTLENIKKLNTIMNLLDKNYYDHDLAEKFNITGTSYRLILPNDDEESNNAIPFKIYDVDTSSAFVVYHSGIGHKPLLGVIITSVFNKQINAIETVISCYSKSEFFKIIGSEIIEKRDHQIGAVPLIEYPNNIARLGSFELVLPLLDAINHARSSEFDGIDQTVQSLLKFINTDISAEDFNKLKEMGAIKIKSVAGQNADVDYITQRLDQTTIEQIINSLDADIRAIAGMPNQKGSTESTSDNMGAVLLRNGWSGAESRAKGTELVFKKSEKQMLTIAMRLMKTMNKIDLSISDIDIKMPRRNYENIAQKSTVLTQMLGSNKIHPKLAFEHCGMFTDPEVAYMMSEQYVKKLQEIQDKIVASEKEKNEQVDEDSKTSNDDKVINNGNKVNTGNN